MPQNPSLYLVFVIVVLGYFMVRHLIPLLGGIFEWISSRDWSQTTGQILSSEVDTVPAPPDGKKGTSVSAKLLFVPTIAYEYQVDGKIFKSNKIFVGSKSFASDFVDAEKVVNKYPKNKSVMVFYNPSKPEVSFLERKVPEQFVGNAVFGILLLTLLSLFLAFAGIIK